MGEACHQRSCGLRMGCVTLGTLRVLDRNETISSRPGGERPCSERLDLLKSRFESVVRNVRLVHLLEFDPDYQRSR
jgi:hypothetical protein